MPASPLCEDPRVERLSQWPLIEMRWETWRSLHPNTLVLDAPRGAGGNTASRSPTGYDGHPSAAPSRSERVIGAPSSLEDPGIAFSFGRLVDLSGNRQVIAFTYDGESFRLLWSDEAMGGMAYSPRTVSGHAVDLVPEEGDPSTEGGFRGQNTGSLFTLDGRAVAAPLEGEALVPLVEAYVAYRGPWLDFHPSSRMWGE